jgi:hypothetical protein
MQHKKPTPLEMAFKKPYASESCITVGKVLADGSERSEYEIRKLTNLTEHDMVTALINLEKRAGIVESRPLITTDYIKKGTTIPIVYKFKKKYLNELKKNSEYLK